MRCPEMARKGTCPVPSHKARCCQVPGCADDLHGGPKYYRRYRICNLHCNQPSLDLPGLGVVRFCHLCRHFQPLKDFLGARKSCRASLAEHRLRSQRRGQAQGSGARPMGEGSAEEHNSGAQHGSAECEQQEGAAAQHSSSRLPPQDSQQNSSAAQAGRPQRVGPESPRAGDELVVDSWRPGLPAAATPGGAAPAWPPHGDQLQQTAEGTSKTLAPGHSASIVSLASLLLPGAAAAGQLPEAAGPAQQSCGTEGAPLQHSPAELDDFMDWLVDLEQPDSVSEWLSSVEVEVEVEQSSPALPPVATAAERRGCQVSELPTKGMQQLQPGRSTCPTCPTPPETPIQAGAGPTGCGMLSADHFRPQTSPAGSLESMPQWWPGSAATLLAAATYASAAGLAGQQGLARPLQPAPPLPGTQAGLNYPGSVAPLSEQQCLSGLSQPVPLLQAQQAQQVPPQSQPPQPLWQPSLELQQQCSSFGSVEGDLSFAVQWRAEQLSLGLFNVPTHLLPLGLLQTILHIAAQP